MLRVWFGGALVVASALLLAVWVIASLSLADPTIARSARAQREPGVGDVLHILFRNSLVLALHAFACVAGFIAGSSLLLSAARRSGLSRWVHEKARPIAFGWVVLVTCFSLATQAYALGLTGAQLAHQLWISPGVLVVTVLPHAIPELVALFLPLAAWTIASRRDEWHDLLAATFVTVAIAIPMLVAAATWEVYVWPHILRSSRRCRSGPGQAAWSASSPSRARRKTRSSSSNRKPQRWWRSSRVRRLVSRIALRGRAAIRSASATARGTTSPGTTSRTIPSRCASGALDDAAGEAELLGDGRRQHGARRRVARRDPARELRIAEARAVGATRRSHSSERAKPPASAGPLTAATTGRRQLPTAWKARVLVSTRRSRLSRSPPNWLVSIPEQNAGRRRSGRRSRSPCRWRRRVMSCTSFGWSC